MAPCFTGEEHSGDGSRIGCLSLEVHRLRSLRGPELYPRWEKVMIYRAVGDSNPHHSNGSPTVLPYCLLPGMVSPLPRIPRYTVKEPIPRLTVGRVILP